ncbi:MAG TPA: RNA polymerase factor sigma-54 [Phycisphaerae bacterium]|nr:RNA polymerase factor sigma-54 [Phycisphaerae bacterium]
MSQYLSMLPSQQMRLEQRLTPQLIQSMEILTLPLLALEAKVREELESNPVLEELEPEAPPTDKAPREDLPASESNNAEAESFERLERMSREMEFDPGDLPYGRGGAGGGMNTDRDSKLDAMANTASRGECLRDQLLKQWSLVDTSPEIKQAGEAIIDWLDEDGYLRTEEEHHPTRDNGDTPEATPLIIERSPEQHAQLMEQIARSRTPPPQFTVLNEALALVQTLEPTGVAARDLSECLLIQLRAKQEANPDGPEANPLCEELVRHHLGDLARNLYPAVSKATGASIDEIKDALKTIGKLNHHPGLLVQPSNVPRISPDILVDYAEEGDGYTLRLARGNSPRLRISHQYRQMLQDRSTDKATRDFIKGRIESASVLKDAIEYRRQRLLQIGHILLERQREFFDYGPQFLKVLRMRDLAEELGCDPSTISRTVDGKYIQSPRGLYPLRQFFAGGTTVGSGETVTWDSMKARVKEIIDGEDKTKPLTDDEIVKIYNQTAKIPVARRTVAKYRQQLGIPPHRERRVY